LTLVGEQDEKANLSPSVQSVSQQQFTLHWFVVKSHVQSEMM